MLSPLEVTSVSMWLPNTSLIAPFRRPKEGKGEGVVHPKTDHTWPFTGCEKEWWMLSPFPAGQRRGVKGVFHKVRFSAEHRPSHAPLPRCAGKGVESECLGLSVGSGV